MGICYCAKVTKRRCHGEIDGRVNDSTKQCDCQTNMDWYSNGPVLLWPVCKSQRMQETIRNYCPNKIECKGRITAKIQYKAINSSAWIGSRCVFWHCQVCRSSHKHVTSNQALHGTQLLVMAVLFTSWWSKLLHCFGKQYQVLHKWSKRNSQLTGFGGT